MDNRWVDGWIMDDGALILVDVFIHVHKKEKTSPIKVRQCKLIKDVFSVAADNGGENWTSLQAFVAQWVPGSCSHDTVSS